MPKKPKRPCSYPGCPELVEGRFCKKHETQEQRRYERYERNPKTKRRYGRTWKRIHDRYIHLHPLCEECLKEKKATPAEQVHHILPLSEGGSNREDNLMALCKSCHSKIHAKRGDRWS